MKAQSDLRRTAGSFVVVCLILTGVWALSGAGYFWPAWAIFAVSIAPAFSAYSAFGPRERPPSQSEIDEQMRKFRGEE